MVGVWAVPLGRLMVMLKSESSVGEEVPLAQVVVVSVVLVTELVPLAAGVEAAVESRDTVKGSLESY